MNDKLTAYALNELPPDEKAALEQQMAQDPALREEAEAMKAFCGLLQEQVGPAESPELTGDQRSEVLKAFLNTPRKANRPAFWKRAEFISTAIAAGLALTLLVPSGVLLERRQPVMESEARAPANGLESIQILTGTQSENKSKAYVGKKELAAAPLSRQRADETPELGQAAPPTLAESLSTLPATPPPPPAPIVNAPLPEPAAGRGATLSFRQGMAVPQDATKDQFGASPSGQDLDVRREWTQPLLPAPGEPKAKPVEVTPLAPSGPLAAASKPVAPPASSPAPATRVNVVTTSGALAAKAEENSFHLAPAADAAAPTGGRMLSRTPSLDASGLVVADPVAEAESLARDKDVDEQRFGRLPALATTAGESYTPIQENPFLPVAQAPVSTFSIDVDTASYANVRRFLNAGQRPPADAVRIEELVNYFPYALEPPADGHPFAVRVDLAEAPWKPEHRLARVTLKGREPARERVPANFVFLVDVSGSMDEPSKLPLVKQSLLMLVERLATTDHVALVTYAGSTAVALPSTPLGEKSRIIEAIQTLGAGGSTNGAGGLRLAYEQAQKHFQKEGVNRVILCTDGDFNVGISSPEELEKLITEKARSRVFLSVLGFGTGNLKDRTMETLADKGNGNYAYIDSLSEARKVLVEQMNATLVTIAKDVKIQVEFNPAQVQAYRLVGYENRLLARQDFNDDRKDAGEIGEGHTVTALYEIVPAHAKFPDGRPLVDSLRYVPAPAAPAVAGVPLDAATSRETMTVKLRYKQPHGDVSTLMEVPVTDKEAKLSDSSGEFKFAAAVAGFGMLLRQSAHVGELNWDKVRELALAGKGPDEQGYRGEFLQLIEKARGLTSGPGR